MVPTGFRQGDQYITFFFISLYCFTLTNLVYM